MSKNKEGALPFRADMPKNTQWQLEDIYADNAAWEADFEKLKALLPEVAGFAGKLGENAEFLRMGLDKLMEANLLTERLYVYARMRRDEDNTQELYQAMADRAAQLAVQLDADSAYFTPEVLHIPWVEQAVEKDEAGLALYRQYLRNILRMKAHTLPAGEERLLAMAGDMAGACDNIFTMINNADIRFPYVPDGSGGEVELTHGRYGQLMESSDRKVRKAAYEALYDTYGKQINTLAATYAGSVKKDNFFAGARGYASALEAALDANAVPVRVYDALVDAIHNHLDGLHRYMDLRARVLGIRDLKMYDVYVPIVPEADMRFTWEEAKQIVTEALSVLGADYAAMVQKALDERWVDVYENRGKTSGAYSWGVYGSHPFVLMNFQGTVDHVFTLAHELGHAMHSHYSNEALPYVDAGYSIMVAEVASTVNEQLLLHEFLRRTQDKAKRAYLLNYALEQVRGTVYRQVMFAEFERETHRMAQEGQPLTAESLGQQYGGLNRQYYGPRMETDERISTEWARIPHFYDAFYVYQYATGYSSAVKLAEDILSGDGEAVRRYRAFLRSGGSDYPIRLLQNAGVDLTGPEPVARCLKYFSHTLAQLEALL